MGLGIFNIDGEMWKHQRKVVTVEFASSKLRDYSIHTYREEALKLVQVLAIAAARGQPMDIQVMHAKNRGSSMINYHNVLCLVFNLYSVLRYTG
jgi:cytochrome P450